MSEIENVTFANGVPLRGPSPWLFCYKVKPKWWPEHIGISDQLLERADARFIMQGDGMVRFTMSDGETALYGIRHDGDVPDASHYDLIHPGRTYPL